MDITREEAEEEELTEDGAGWRQRVAQCTRLGEG